MIVSRIMARGPQTAVLVFINEATKNGATKGGWDGKEKEPSAREGTAKVWAFRREDLPDVAH